MKCQRSMSHRTNQKNPTLGLLAPLKSIDFNETEYDHPVPHSSKYITHTVSLLEVKGQGHRGRSNSIMTIVTNETTFFHFPFNRSSPNWVGTFMGSSHRSSSKETFKRQGHRGQIMKITHSPFRPLSTVWISTKWVWASSAALYNLFYTSFDLRSKVKVTEVK